MADQGIARQRGSLPGPPSVAARPDVQALAGDVRALARFCGEVARALSAVDDQLSRRLNELLISGTLAERPTAGLQDRLYIASDQAAGSNLYWDSGSAWVVV